ncbi:MAG TPA: hypothetical protein DCW44_02635 [Eubacterium sp.]|nr:hypothetical protein [Eubacterium sp.]
MKKKKYLAIGGACVVLTLGAFFSTQNKGKSDDNQNISKAAGAVTNVENTTSEGAAGSSNNGEATTEKSEGGDGSGDINNPESKDIATPNKKLTKYEKYKETLKGMGVVDLGDSDVEALYVHETMDKKSKTVGYLPHGGKMKILEKLDDNNWYKIKSGKIKGFVRSKYVLTGKKMKEAIVYNKDVIAHVEGENVGILGKANRDSTVVAIGYKEADYPIEAFSDNRKYAYVERTATITGWIPISKIKIQVTCPKAMDKEEFKEYQREYSEKEKKELESYLSISLQPTGNSLLDSIIKLVSHNESGNFKSARNPITGGEKTITVGAWQWYGENAHNILRQICNANRDKAAEIIESAFAGRRGRDKAEKLYEDILGSKNWVNEKRLFSNEELIAVKGLLGSDQGVKVQSSKIQSDIQAKVTVAIRTYNLSNDALVAYFCDLFWQNPAQARAVVDECIDHFGGARGFSRARNGLRYLHRKALNNHTFGRFTRRREYTYSYCQRLDEN